MHQNGKEIIAEGYEHVVAISNYHDDDHVFHTPADDFVLALDFELQMQIEGENQWKRPVHYKGFECRLTIQSGDLPGLGIYVFFKNATGANICKHDFV